jgi:hypothetical protein
MSTARRIAAVASAVLIIVLVPASLVARAAHSALFDTQTFAKLSTALITDAAFRDELVDSFTDSAMEGVDIGRLVPERILRAAGLTTEDLELRVESVVRAGVTSAVGSEAFVVLWEEASRAAHVSFLDALDNVGATPAVVVDMTPLVSEVAARMEDDGPVGRLVALADLLPDGTDFRYEVLDENEVGTLRVVETVASVLRWLLPLVAAFVAATATALLPDRRAGIRLVAGGTAAGAVGLFIARAGTAGLVESASGDRADTARAVFDIVTAGLTVPATATVVVASAAACATYLHRRPDDVMSDGGA